MNVLYRHVDNPVDLSLAGYTADQIQPRVDNGTIRKENGEFILRPGAGRNARITVTATDDQGISKQFGPVDFRVKDLPAPIAFLGSKSSMDSRIRKSEAEGQRQLVAKLPDTEFAVEYEVVSAKLMAKNREGIPVDIPLPGGRITQDARQYISSLSKSEDPQHRRCQGASSRDHCTDL